MLKKKCFKCGKIKYLDDFYSHPDMPDGHLNKCKECTKKEAKENRTKNIEYYKDYDRNRKNKKDRREKAKQYSKNNPEKLTEGHKRYIQKNPEKRKAHITVSNAIRDGKLIKGLCEVCGSETVEAHHDDYSRPLLVRWLCKKHHTDFHLNKNEENRK